MSQNINPLSPELIAALDGEELGGLSMLADAVAEESTAYAMLLRALIDQSLAAHNRGETPNPSGLLQEAARWDNVRLADAAFTSHIAAAMTADYDTPVHDVARALSMAFAVITRNRLKQTGTDAE